MQIFYDVSKYVVDPEEAWKRLRVGKFHGRRFQIMRTVAAWRERQAQIYNVPRRHILSDESIFGLAMQEPASQEHMAQIVTRSFWLRRHLEAVNALWDAISCISQTEPDNPKVERQTVSREKLTVAAQLAELLKLLLKVRAQAVGIAPQMIATVDDITELINTDLSQSRLLTGWRRAVFGEDALRLKQGEISILEKRLVCR